MTQKQPPSENTNNSPWVIVYLFGALALAALACLLIGLIAVAVNVAS
jgi:hypothetical protein